MRLVAGSILIVGSLLWIALLAIAVATWSENPDFSIWKRFVHDCTETPFIIAVLVAGLGVYLLFTSKEPRE